MNIETIDKNADSYAKAREELSDLVASMQAEQANVKRKYLPRLRRAVAKAKERREELYTDVQVSPDLFKKPKSRILHGIRVGWKKARGKISWSDTGKLIKRIRTVLPDKADELIRVEEKVRKTDLQKLDAATLKRLGVEVTADQDIAFVEPTDGEVDRIVTALLDEKDLEEAA